MTVRPATVEDQLAVAELNAVVQQMHHDVAPEWFKPPDMEAIVDYFRQALRSDALRAFVVDADVAVSGYALARLQKQPETALTDGGLVVELDQISVTRRIEDGADSARRIRRTAHGRRRGCRRDARGQSVT